jgi:general secretion pathway protein E
MVRLRLGEFLVQKNMVRDADVENALAVQSSVGGLLGLILVRLGALSESDLLLALSDQLGLSIQSREAMPAPAQVQALIDDTRTNASWWADRQALAWRHSHQSLEGEAVAIDDEAHEDTGPANGALICCAVHPLDPELRSFLEQYTADNIEWRLAPRVLVSAAIDDLDNVSALDFVGSSDTARLRELAEEAPVIDFVNTVFAEALQRRASDIHVEPFEDRFFVRMRVDGILHTVRSANRATFDAVCSRIKLLSGMDIGERRLPQDGRQAIRIAGQEVDLRVSALPAAWGESVVLRLLGKTNRIPELTELGLPAVDATRLARLVEQPNGIVLVTGPTGSGKTTTIYRLLAGLNDGQRKIVTVEDPVEFDLPGVIQVHVRSDIGLTFAAGLRSILRQDPDVIMVGEIRDPETARIAVQAALTGHMVISTVHTNSALAAVARLLDLGVEDYLLADVLRGLVGQRLVRKLCPVCSTQCEPRVEADWLSAAPDIVAVDLAAKPANFREAKGCARCGQSGFSGRSGLYEIAVVTPELASALRRRESESTLRDMARRDGFRTMFEDGVLKAARGDTTMGEIFRVIGPTELEAYRPAAPSIPASRRLEGVGQP